MTIEESLRNARGQKFIANIAAYFGVDEHNAEAAVWSLAEEFSARIQRAMLSRGGVANVVSLITAPGVQSALADPASFNSPGVVEDGNEILDVLIGSKHVSRGIAARTATATGVDAAIVQKMLPVVATWMIGELQRQSGPQIAKVASRIPGFAGAGGSPLPLPGDSFPAPVSETPPDDQSATRGLPRAPGGIVYGGQPLPVPGDTIPGIGRRGTYPTPYPETDDNPYSRLPDIVRRGGERVPGPDGGSLENVIRSILGNLLGSNSGIVGTMIKLFLIRWLASVVRRILATAGR